MVLRPPHRSSPRPPCVPARRSHHEGRWNAAPYPDAGDGPDFMPRAVACHDQSQTQADRKIRVSVVRKPRTNRPIRALLSPLPVLRERARVRVFSASVTTIRTHASTDSSGHAEDSLPFQPPGTPMMSDTLERSPRLQPYQAKGMQSKPPRAKARPRRLTRKQILNDE